MKHGNNLIRLALLIIGGVTLIMAMWALDGGSGFTITYEEGTLMLLFGIMAVLVMNGSER